MPRLSNHRRSRPRLQVQVEALESRRVLADGDLDPGFGKFGINLDDDAVARDVAIRRDGKIVIAGSWFKGVSVVQLNPNGTFDTGFDADGKLFVTFPGTSQNTAKGLLLQPDGKILVYGSTFSGIGDLAIARLNADGTLDTTFDGDGIRTLRFAPNVGLNVGGAALQADGKIVIAGSTGFSVKADFGVVRLNSDGSLDTSFGTGGTQTVAFNLIANGDDLLADVALQSDGKIVLAGSAERGLNQADVAVARLTASGQLDSTFDGDGKRTFAFDQPDRNRNLGSSLAIQANGKIVIGGSVDSGATNALMVAARLNVDGSLDTSFDGDGKQALSIANARANSVAIQHDGKILLAGTMPGPEDFDFAFARLGADGALDTTFASDGSISYNFSDFLYFSSDGVQAVAYQADGKIVAVGSTTLTDAEHTAKYAVLRLQSTPPPLATTTTLTASTTSLPFGQSVTFTATVAPAGATGNVTFLDGTVALGTVPLSGGTAAFSIAGLAVGNHAITARYEGTSTHAVSTSVVRTFTVTALPTTTTLAVTAPPISFGQDVTFTATVGPVGTTGVVRFLKGTATVGTATLSGGTASFTTRDLGTGSHTITARYEGDAIHAASTSIPQTIVVKALTTTTALTGSGSTSTFGQTLTFTAAVTPENATGPVRFLDGENLLGLVYLVDGRAVLDISTLPAGTHTISARFQGSVDFLASDAEPWTVTVGRAEATVTLAAPIEPLDFGQPLTLRATVAADGITPGGMVTFLEGDVTLGSVALIEGAAELVVGGLDLGPHTIEARYGGNSNVLAAASLPRTIEVVRAPTVTVLDPLPASAAFGQAIVLKATVTAPVASGPPAGGSVTFLDGSTVLGTVPLAAGLASLNVVGPTLGEHRFSARYDGDLHHGTSIADARTVTVRAAVTVTLTAPASPTLLGQPVALSATVTSVAGTPTGSIVFLAGATVLSTVPLLNGAAGLNTSLLTLGSHTLSARYEPGNTPFLTGTSAPRALVVERSTTLTTLTVPDGPATAGQSLTISATVSAGTETPGGSVVFLDGSAVLGTVPLVNGSASLAVPAFAAGTHALTARYEPNSAAFLGSVSGMRTLVVETPEPVVMSTTIALTMSVGPFPQGQPISLTATVVADGGVVSGNVLFFDGSTALGSAPLVDGRATLTISGLAVGGHAIEARYEGAEGFAAGRSEARVVTVAAPPPTVILGASTTIDRKKALTAITLRVLGPLDPLSAAVLNGYSLTYAGRDKKFGTKDDVKIRLASARYDTTASILTLTPRGKTTLTGTARLVVDGPRDPSGRFLDGNRDGVSGGAYFVMIPKKGLRS